MKHPAPPPKPDPLSPEERAEVERRVASGEVTACPVHMMSAVITGSTRLRLRRIAARQKRFWLARRKRSGLAE